ncbi:DedA family protein [Nocardioides mangrovi]|uniref:VTT domain-containing protein n=1 Tax=Nocardioides mangrovi TaxID=2874580 RepID=A0ABS7U8G4_9ACTN|nr:VTT domain-containing protein [Nocardioides mangrovi]MBZ5737175.1 VTT domain-containing protein [Nocardioides mangrovi]
MSGAIDSLLTSLGPLAVLIVAAIVFAESGILAGFFLPGDSLLFTTGLLVAHGTIGVPIWVVAPVVAAAAVAGDQVGYLIGRRAGPRVLSRPSSRLLTPAHLERAATFFDRHGPRAVVLARFVPVARTFTPVAAGAGRMPYPTFVTFNVIGGVAWTVLMLAAGYLLGGVALVSQHIELITLGVVAVSLLPAAVSVVRGRARGPRVPQH